MRGVAVITPASSLGGQVLAALAGERAVAIPPDLAPGELKRRLQDAGADTMIDLDGTATADVLTAAADAAVTHVVILSSATVYGAWSDNPVPLPEDAASRPNPGFAYAAEKAESERLAVEWKDDHPGTSAAILRAAVTVGDDLDALGRVLTGTAGLRPVESSRPVQFLAEADLAGAVALAATARLDGVFNVAPDGWVPDETARALAGGPARLPVTERMARPARAAARVVGVAKSWPGIEPYTHHPWVVANDKLRAAGWKPAHTNEEAFVAAASRWPELSPKRRQEVALAGMGLGLAGVAGAIVALVRRARRHTR
jgi:nucleoside-diphosphate-sugar epimerase